MSFLAKLHVGADVHRIMSFDFGATQKTQFANPVANPVFNDVFMTLESSGKPFWLQHMAQSIRIPEMTLVLYKRDSEAKLTSYDFKDCFVSSYQQRFDGYNGGAMVDVVAINFAILKTEYFQHSNIPGKKGSGGAASGNSGSSSPPPPSGGVSSFNPND